MTTTTTAKKPTKKQMYSAIIAKYPLTEDEKTFLNHEIELLEKKNSADKKPTAIQVANNGLKEAILNHMEKGKTYTVSVLIKEVSALNELSNQKVTALMRGLIDEGKVEKFTEKKATLFRVVSND